MMKQKLNLWLLAALLCGMSLSVTSCKDDDNSGEADGPEGVTEVSETFNNAAYSVIDKLADTDDADTNFLAQTFEPSIGMPDGGDESVRIVNTNTMELAAQRFAELADAAIDENTQTYTWSNELLGTMTYRKATDGKAWATVDVDIRQVPHLRRIIFRDPEQADANARFDGCAYYRFGDVISRVVTNKDGTSVKEYWVCVRPAFGIEKKEDSHWVCLNALPQKNVYTWSKTYKKGEYSGKTEQWWVPTGLDTNKEHMQNLAEMLYAMLHPAEWEANVKSKDNAKLKFFHDFSKDPERIRLHNQHFWGNVCKKWDDMKDNDGKTVWQRVFNTTKDSLLRQIDDSNGGLRLLHEGKHWPVGMTCQLWEAIYTKGTGNNSNMHSDSYIKPKHNMEHITVDCRTMGSALKNYNAFFDNDNKLRFCIRHATGKELTAKGGKYDVRSKIHGAEDVYRYYNDVNKIETGNLINTDPEETSANDKDGDGIKDPEEEPKDEPVVEDPDVVQDADLKVGHFIAADGKFYSTKESADEKGGGARAVVVYLGGDKRVEDGAAWNGLAMSLVKTKNAQFITDPSLGSCAGLKLYDSTDKARKAFDGIASTDCFTNCKKAGHDHSTFLTTLGKFDKVEGPKDLMTSWFLPSFGQFMLAMEGLDIKSAGSGFKLPDNNNPYFADVRTLLQGESILTSSFDIGGPYFIMYFFNLERMTNAHTADTANTLIPFIAFKYGEGGKQNQN